MLGLSAGLLFVLIGIAFFYMGKSAASHEHPAKVSMKHAFQYVQHPHNRKSELEPWLMPMLGVETVGDRSLERMQLALWRRNDDTQCRVH